MRRRELIAAAPLVATAGCTIGGEPPDGSAFDITVPDAEGMLPEQYTCDGEGVSPPLRITSIPSGTASLAVVGEWLRGYTPRTIWLLWGLPATESLEIPPGIGDEQTPDAFEEAVQGATEDGAIGYQPPCHESPDHDSYRFIAHALPEPLDLEPGASRDDLDDHISDTLTDVSSTSVQVRYERFR